MSGAHLSGSFGDDPAHKPLCFAGAMLRWWVLAQLPLPRASCHAIYKTITRALTRLGQTEAGRRQLLRPHRAAQRVRRLRGRQVAAAKGSFRCGSLSFTF